jgi:hypothetical protein
MCESKGGKWMYAGSILWLLCLIPVEIDRHLTLDGLTHSIVIGATWALLAAGLVMILFGGLKDALPHKYTQPAASHSKSELQDKQPQADGA